VIESTWIFGYNARQFCQTEYNLFEYRPQFFRGQLIVRKGGSVVGRHEEVSNSKGCQELQFCDQFVWQSNDVRYGITLFERDAPSQD